MGYVVEDDDNLFLIINKQRMVQFFFFVNVFLVYVDIDKVYINVVFRLLYQRVVLVDSSCLNWKYGMY